MSKRRNTSRTKATIAYKKEHGSFCEICGWCVPHEVLSKCAWNYTRKYGGINCHHVVPVSHGGKDIFDNLICLCPNHHAIAHLVTKRVGKHIYGPKTKQELRDALIEIDNNPVRWAEKDDNDLSGIDGFLGYLRKYNNMPAKAKGGA